MSSWITDAAGFGKKLLFLSERVEKNAEDIKTLRQDLNQLQSETNKIVGAVRFNRSKIGEFREWVDSKDEAIYWKLRAELADFEKRMTILSFTQPQASETDASAGTRPTLGSLDSPTEQP